MSKVACNIMIKEYDSVVLKKLMLICEQELNVAKSIVDWTHLFSYSLLFWCGNAWKIQKKKRREQNHANDLGNSVLNKS